MQLEVLAGEKNGINIAIAAGEKTKMEMSRITIAPAHRQELSIIRAFQWCSLMYSKEKDFAVQPFLSMKAKVSDLSTQMNPVAMATRTVAWKSLYALSPV